MRTRSWIRHLFARPVIRPFRKAPFRARPALEVLEHRTVPSFTVTNTLDDGSVGSLRWAVGSGRRPLYHGRRRLRAPDPDPGQCRFDQRR
jgi:hypothetical protein